MANVLKLHDCPDVRDMVHAAVQALVEGEVVIVPTDSVYGLAANALSERAVGRLCEIKSRDRSAPTAISVPSVDAAGDFFCRLSPLAHRLGRRCWPGPLTLVVPCESPHSALHQLPAGVRQAITGPYEGVGFRVIDHRVMAHVHRLVSAPLVLTSANVDGQEPPTTAEAAMGNLGDHVPLLLDDGPTRYGGSSTVVRVVGSRMEVLREGAIERAAMNQFAKPVIVLVCTGNTCRSPMAETLLRHQVAERFGSEDAIRVISAGVAASPGAVASSQAVEVMGKRNLDLTGHAAQPLDDTIINVADLILTMTRGHRAAILAAWPHLNDRVHTLRHDGGDITDPVGSPVEVYEACATQIEGELRRWLDQLPEGFIVGTDPSEADGDGS